jgi:hypothetical protein
MGEGTSEPETSKVRRERSTLARQSATAGQVDVAASGGVDDRQVQVVMPNGKTWTRRPGGRSTGAQVIHAWEEIRKLHDEAEQWHCWEEDHETRVLDQWEPILAEWDNGAPKRSPAESAAFFAAIDAEVDERLAEEERQRVSRAAQQYDKDRAQQRMTLLQHESSAAFFRHVLTAPATPAQAAAAEEQSAKSDALAVQLRKQLGDPNLIVDKHGYLPAERRERHLNEHMRSWRHPVLRAWSQDDRKRFNALLRMPRPEPAAMCSECQAPQQWHEYALSLCLFRGRPEPGSRAERIARIMPEWWARCSACTTYQMVHRWGGSGTLPDFDYNQWCAMVPTGLRKIFGLTAVKPEPEDMCPPPPAPLEILKPGPIDEVMQRLNDARAKHPNAELRKGKRGAWELWPS